jgi:hypothetical protein
MNSEKDVDFSREKLSLTQDEFVKLAQDLRE